MKGTSMATSGGGEKFWNFCFEMVHFCAKVTNAVHYHWFSGSYSEKTDFRLITFFGHNVREGGLNS